MEISLSFNQSQSEVQFLELSINYQIEKLLLNMFHHPIPSPLPDLLSLQNTETIRLQRLIQQRKRMQHLTLLIQQQKQTIDLLQQQNFSINQQFCQLKLQNQLLTDKLTVSTHHCRDLTDVLVKQISLIQTLRGYLFGGHLMSDYEKNILDQEIQTSLSLYHAIEAGKASLHISNFNSQITELAEENQLLNEKYQNLCADYLELNKTLKVKEYEILKLQKNKYTGTRRNNQENSENESDEKDQNQQLQKGEKRTTSKEKAKSKKELQNLLKIRQLQIVQFKKIIQKIKQDISRKDELIREHRKNQKEQKKLMDHLRIKFNEEGKQLQQIAKSKHIIEVADNTKSQLTYQIEKPIMKSSVRKVVQVIPGNQIIQTKVFQEKNLNLNHCKMNNSSHLKVLSRAQSTNQQVKDSGFKKTVSKCVLEN